MLENIRLSFQGIWSHKMRSFLTMLGIIIGIAAIIAIVSTITGTNEQIKQNLIGSGDNSVQVQIYQGDNPYEMEYNGIPEGVPVISDNVLEEIKGVEQIIDATRYVARDTYNIIYHQNMGLSGGKAYGVEQNYFDTCNYVVKRGRVFDAKDYEKFRKVAVLDDSSSEALFKGEDPIGKTIEINQEPYVVIGLIEKSSKFEPVINSMDDYYLYVQSTSGSVYVPISTWPAIYDYDEPEKLTLKVGNTEDMTVAGKRGADILNTYISPTDETMKYKAINLLEQAKEIQELGESTNTMLIWIAGISLIVGGIGVMNIMLVSVTERTQEIGLKKAIGARKNRILGQFLTEAAVLTSLGGFIGVVVGIVLAQVISKITTTPVAISVPASVLAVVFSMVIGIVFGLLPSYKAANLNPIEALHRE
ncbi:ABC transporter permease [Lachnospiraceae bacterium ZAX-1]